MRKAWSVKRAVCHPIILQVKSFFVFLARKFKTLYSTTERKKHRKINLKKLMSVFVPFCV